MVVAQIQHDTEKIARGS